MVGEALMIPWKCDAEAELLAVVSLGGAERLERLLQRWCRAGGTLDLGLRRAALGGASEEARLLVGARPPWELVDYALDHPAYRVFYRAFAADKTGLAGVYLPWGLRAAAPPEPPEVGGIVLLDRDGGRPWRLRTEELEELCAGARPGAAVGPNGPLAVHAAAAAERPLQVPFYVGWESETAETARAEQALDRLLAQIEELKERSRAWSWRAWSWREHADQPRAQALVYADGADGQAGSAADLSRWFAEASAEELASLRHASVSLAEVDETAPAWLRAPVHLVLPADPAAPPLATPPPARLELRRDPRWADAGYSVWVSRERRIVAPPAGQAPRDALVRALWNLPPQAGTQHLPHLFLLSTPAWSGRFTVAEATLHSLAGAPVELAPDAVHRQLAARVETEADFAAARRMVADVTHQAAAELHAECDRLRQTLNTIWQRRDRLQEYLDLVARTTRTAAEIEGRAQQMDGLRTNQWTDWHDFVQAVVATDDDVHGHLVPPGLGGLLGLRCRIDELLRRLGPHTAAWLAAPAAPVAEADREEREQIAATLRGEAAHLAGLARDLEAAAKRLAPGEGATHAAGTR